MAIMKSTLLRQIRKRTYLKRRNSKYMAMIKGSFFAPGLDSGHWAVKEEAIKDLRKLIIIMAHIQFKRKPLKVR